MPQAPIKPNPIMKSQKAIADMSPIELAAWRNETTREYLKAAAGNLADARRFIRSSFGTTGADRDGPVAVRADYRLQDAERAVCEVNDLLLAAMGKLSA